MKLLLLVVLTIFTVLGFSYPSVFLISAEAGVAVYDLPNYDIRTDPSAGSKAKLATLRGSSTGDLRDPARGSSRFRIDYNHALEIAEVISATGASPLTIARSSTRTRRLKEFINQNNDVFLISSPAQLYEAADYTNPDGNLSFVRLEQMLGDVPVFGAEITAGFTKRNEMFRVVNSLAPGLNRENASVDFGNAATAVARAAGHIGAEVSENDLTRRDSSKPGKIEFHTSFFSENVSAEKFYFPIGRGVAVPAWRVLLPTRSSSHYVVVDADGTMLWRRNLIEEQSISATYNVYGNGSSPMRTADSPAPLTPGCNSPTCGQPPVTSRANFGLIGNEALYTFNNLGWIPDTGLPVRTPANNNITDGNNVEAGIDRDGTQGVDDNGWAFGNPTRVFSYTYNPAPGNPPPGEEPIPAGPQVYPPSQFQQGAATQGFYMINRWHDEMYRLGFNEQARNFQHFNFGRGGAEGDRVSLEIQDSSLTNGSSFSISADGNRPRIQLSTWTAPTPDRDGDLDAQMVVHEMTHGLTARLHGNATGLSSNMARGMGEGWSDLYAAALLAEYSDDPLGTHALGGYVAYQALAGYEANYYYGIRRFPIALRASLGPNGLPHNPLTFRYINSDCASLIGTTTTNPNSAFPRGPIGSDTCDQIHNLGEVWAVILWEVRAQLINRHDPVEGNRRALQYITDGMKLSPLNPTMIQARDSIISAATFSDAADAAAVWRGFAIRGMGSSATVINPGTGANDTVVAESFEIPAQFRRPTRADFDDDGKSDVSVFRPSDRNWYLNRSTAGFSSVNWGLPTDKPLADDFDGDGKSDITVFRATADGAEPDYYTLLSATSAVSFVSWGSPGDIPFTEDFDGDNKSDHTIFRPSSGQFWVRRSTDGSILISRPIPGIVHFVGDFDGDGKGDFGSFNDGTWLLSQSENNYTSGLLVNWGTSGDRPVPADYDGDGKDDVAIYRPSNGTWYIATSSNGNRFVNFGISTDTPVPADYDGDGRSDVAIFRNGVWYINRSTGGVTITSFGLSGDVPLPATFVP